MDRERLHFLLDRYVDGALETDEKSELERMLLSSPEARAEFWEKARFHALLRRLGEETWGQRAAEPESKIVRFPRARAAWLAAAACLLLGGLALASRFLPLLGEATTNGVAMMGPLVEAVWEDGRERRAGEVLAPGPLRLKSGLAQIEFVSGARVIVEGPAELDLRTPLEAFCRAGRLSVEVPPQATGFRVGSPKATVVDLGTEFGMNVQGDGATDVHVFRGRVEVRGANATIPVAEGGNARVGSDGQVAQFDGAAPVFATSEQLEARAVDGSRARLARWQLASRQLATLPGLALFFDFQSGTPWGRTLPNLSEDAARGPDGSIVGCRWAEGRWAGKGALDFRTVTDRVRISAPGEFASFTFAMWARVDGLDHTYNSLLMVDGWHPGAAHWQISRKGEIILGVNGDTNYQTRAVFPPERLGQWVHLAVTFDRAAGRAVHYVDGRAISEHPVKPGLAMTRLDQAEIGNWNQKSRRDNQPVRSFSGRMDEVLVFRRALSAEEVAALCRSGQGS